ncbi:MAG: methyltransferase domain-containing protein [Nitrososphaerota archaeon]|nr:methyltransferase domain-containing protein [Nitrososphaerota archaeon]
MSSRTYLSSDDSALLRSALRRYSGKRCLEIGAGNGGGLIELSKRFAHPVGTDLRPPSDDSWRGSAVDYVLADAAGPFREGTFDLVAFNPPYVPSEGLSDEAVDGGAQGIEVATRFLLEAVRVLKRDGSVVMLLSSDNPVQPVRATCEELGFSMKLLDSKHLFYESLSAYEVSRKR